jgi:hypothetical protein
MKLDVARFIDDLGGTIAVAALLHIRAPSVSGWKEKERIPDDKLIRLAPVSEARGIASRKDLFPTDYADIWPELAADQPPAPVPRPITLPSDITRDRRDPTRPNPYAGTDIDRRAPAGEGAP